MECDVMNCDVPGDVLLLRLLPRQLCLLFVLLPEEVGQTRQLQLVPAYVKHHDGSVLECVS